MAVFWGVIQYIVLTGLIVLWRVFNVRVEIIASVMLIGLFVSSIRYHFQKSYRYFIYEIMNFKKALNEFAEIFKSPL